MARSWYVAPAGVMETSVMLLFFLLITACAGEQTVISPLLPEIQKDQLTIRVDGERLLYLAVDESPYEVKMMTLLTSIPVEVVALGRFWVSDLSSIRIFPTGVWLPADPKRALRVKEFQQCQTDEILGVARIRPGDAGTLQLELAELVCLSQGHIPDGEENPAFPR